MNISGGSVWVTVAVTAAFTYVMFYGGFPARWQIFGPISESAGWRLWGWSMVALGAFVVVAIACATPASLNRRIICTEDRTVIAQYYGRITDDGHRSKMQDKPWMLIQDDNGNTYRHRRGSCWVQP